MIIALDAPDHGIEEDEEPAYAVALEPVRLRLSFDVAQRADLDFLGIGKRRPASPLAIRQPTDQECWEGIPLKRTRLGQF